jgi:uncharacterized protein (DUF934 family)
MPIIKSGHFVEDEFIAITDGEPLPASGTPIVPLERYRKEREQLLSRAQPFGVRLKSSDNPEILREDIKKIAVVAIEFPSFRDGRGFSWARMLRTRLGFEGEIRAVGQFLYDQLAFMVRTGFDAFEVRQDFREEDFARAMREITFYYQPSADGQKTILEQRTGK